MRFVIPSMVVIGLLLTSTWSVCYGTLNVLPMAVAVSAFLLLWRASNYRSRIFAMSVVYAMFWLMVHDAFEGSAQQASRSVRRMSRTSDQLAPLPTRDSPSRTVVLAERLVFLNTCAGQLVIVPILPLAFSVLMGFAVLSDSARRRGMLVIALLVLSALMIYVSTVYCRGQRHRFEQNLSVRSGMHISHILTVVPTLYQGVCRVGHSVPCVGRPYSTYA